MMIKLHFFRGRLLTRNWRATQYVQLYLFPVPLKAVITRFVRRSGYKITTNNKIENTNIQYTKSNAMESPNCTMNFHLEMERYVSTMRTALDEVDNGIQIAKEDRQNKRKPKSLKCPRCQFQIGSMKLMLVHLFDDHNLKGVWPENRKCSFCGTLFFCGKCNK